jgi:hypothetical protein
MRIPVILLPIILLIIFTSILQARTIHVPGDSTTIQSGINGTFDGDTVMVAPGSYFEHVIDFLGKAIIVMSTDPEDSATVMSTVVDANSLGRVFHFHSGEDSTSVLAGLTITGGSTMEGGGIYCYGSSPTVANCMFSGNSAYLGGGMLIDWYSNPTVTNCIFSENLANYDGGMSLRHSSGPISNNIIENNISGSHGGGLYLATFPSDISNNIIAGNISFNGGGIVCDARCSPTISTNLIIGNSAEEGYGRGGGIYVYSLSSPLIINNTIVGNTTDEYGAGGGISCERNCSPAILNSILWGNSSPVGPEIYIGYATHPSSFTIDYSDIEGGMESIFLDSLCTLNWGDGMIDLDPRFVTVDEFEYFLGP